MKNVLKTILLIATIFCSNILRSQDSENKILFDRDTIIIESDVKESKTQYIGIKFLGVLDSLETVSITVNLSASTTVPLNSFYFDNNNIIFSSSNGTNQFMRLVILSDLKDLENKNIDFDLKIVSKSNNCKIEKGKLKIFIKEPKLKYDFVKLFTGTNLDLLNSNSVKLSFYGEIDYYNPQLISDRFGLFGGVYQSRAISPDTLDLGKLTTQFHNKINDTLFQNIGYTFLSRRTFAIRSVGFFMNPVFTLFNKEKTRYEKKCSKFLARNFYPSKGTQLLGQIHLEYIRRSFESRLLVSDLTYNDTTFSSTPLGLNEVQTERFGIGTRNEFYSGLGFILNKSSDKFNLRISTLIGILRLPAIGGTKAPTQLIAPNFINEFYQFSRYYNIKFNATFNPLGIDIGGEVRSMSRSFRNGSYQPNPKQHFYTLYISKVFDIEKLGDFLKSN